MKQRYRDKYGNTESFGEFLAEEQDKFNTEAMVLATFDHPHIVKVYPELFQENGLSCMVMEYVKGKNLEQYLYAKGVFSESAGLSIIKGIGEALSYIHSRNYLHRDIKPANILLREEDNKAILIDFGLAREVNFAELIDMHGNVREWCEDDMQENYINAPTDGSALINLHGECINFPLNGNAFLINKNANERIARGGSWYSRPAYCRSAFRHNLNFFGDFDSDIGFRVVCGGGAART